MDWLLMMLFVVDGGAVIWVLLNGDLLLLLKQNGIGVCGKD